MVESLITILFLLVIVIFIFDVQRRRRSHGDAILREKSDISSLTHMTATMSTFSDGRTTEALIAASEDLGAFFFRLIVRGEVVMRYSLNLNNIMSAELRINGEKRTFDYPSTHSLASLRATEIALQARRDIPPNDFGFIRNVVLSIRFKSETGTEKTIPIQVFKENSTNENRKLPKTLENAIWWQQFLNMVKTSKPMTPAGSVLTEGVPSAPNARNS